MQMSIEPPTGKEVCCHCMTPEEIFELKKDCHKMFNILKSLEIIESEYDAQYYYECSCCREEKYSADVKIVHSEDCKLNNLLKELGERYD